MICIKVYHLFTMTNDYCLSRLLTDLSFLLKDGYNVLELIIQFEFIMTLDYGIKNSTTHQTIIIFITKKREMVIENVEKMRKEKYKQKTIKKNENQR